MVLMNLKSNYKWIFEGNVKKNYEFIERKAEMLFFIAFPFAITLDHSKLLVTHTGELFLSYALPFTSRFIAGLLSKF